MSFICMRIKKYFKINGFALRFASLSLRGLEQLGNGLFLYKRRDYPFKPQYPHTNSPNWWLYISLKNELREFDNRSRHFLLCDHFINSHNLSLHSVWIFDLGHYWDLKGYSHANNVSHKRRVTQTAFIWVILCLLPYLNQLFKFIVLWLPTMRLTLQSSAWTFTLTTEPAQKMQSLISNNFSY